MTSNKQPPPKLWTPDQKIPESVRKMAFLFFLEMFKASFLAEKEPNEWNAEINYRECLELAKIIHMVDAENEPAV